VRGGKGRQRYGVVEGSYSLLVFPMVGGGGGGVGGPVSVGRRLSVTRPRESSVKNSVLRGITKRKEKIVGWGEKKGYHGGVPAIAGRKARGEKKGCLAPVGGGGIERDFGGWRSFRQNSDLRKLGGGPTTPGGEICGKGAVNLGKKSPLGKSGGKTWESQLKQPGGLRKEKVGNKQAERGSSVSMNSVPKKEPSQREGERKVCRARSYAPPDCKKLKPNFHNSRDPHQRRPYTG